jgi:hypothetical protein
VRFRCQYCSTTIQDSTSASTTARQYRIVYEVTSSNEFQRAPVLTQPPIYGTLKRYMLRVTLWLIHLGYIQIASGATPQDMASAAEIDGVSLPCIRSCMHSHISYTTYSGSKCTIQNRMCRYERRYMIEKERNGQKCQMLMFSIPLPLIYASLNPLWFASYYQSYGQVGIGDHHINSQSPCPLTNINRTRSARRISHHARALYRQPTGERSSIDE